MVGYHVIVAEWFVEVVVFDLLWEEWRRQMQVVFEDPVEV